MRIGKFVMVLNEKHPVALGLPTHSPRRDNPAPSLVAEGLLTTSGRFKFHYLNIPHFCYAGGDWQ